MESMLQLFEDPHARHSMMVHLPIVVGTLGVVPLVFLAATRFRSRALGLFCVLWFVLGSIGAALAADAGEKAEEHAEHGAIPLTAAAEQTLSEHEDLGEGGWIWPLIPAALVALTLVPSRTPGEGKGKIGRTLRVGAGSAAIVAALGVGTWVALTAHQGGMLVYVHGVGVPQQTGRHAGGAGLDAPASEAAARETVRDARGQGEEHEHDDD